MKAGRELDALIAEKVMGWRRTTIWVANEETECLIGPDGIRYYNQYPHYSTNIADAWKVVEKMGKLDYIVEIFKDTNGCIIKLTHAQTRVTAEVYALCECIAICLAALKAVDYEEGK